jgi:RHS repeat-associated protein
VRYYYDTQPFAAGFTQNANGRVAAVETGCAGTGAGRLIEMYSYTPAGAVTKKRLRVERPSGTVDRDFVYGYGADGKLATVLYPGASVPFTYTYDLMDRPTKMTGPAPANPGTAVDHAKDVEYGAAGQVTGMKYLQWDDEDEQHYYNETRTYDELYQLIHQKTMGMGGTVAEIGYAYSPNANNGRILSRTNFVRGVVDGEKVTYQYDSLNRVTSAAGTTKNAGGAEVNTWGQNFSYDGFGNLLSQAPRPGFPDASPNVYLTVNGANNRLSSLHWAYDLNGNTTQMPVMGGGTATMTYDVDNRLKKWTGAGGDEYYGYLADNKRVWKKTPVGVETYYLYGLGGQKLMTCSVVESPFALNCAMTHVYFGGKVIRADGEAVVQDRLGSVVARGNVKRDYFPYGDEIGGATAGNVDKFGTYMRDGTTGLDYADQRYYAGSMSGRFLTADPYEASGGAGEPGSWGRYAYVGGDPVNYNDPGGMAKCRVAGFDGATQQARVFCSSDDGLVPEWRWMDAPGAPRLPLDETDPWAMEVTNRAASTWGAALDRMAEGRRQTTQTYRAASRAAIANLAPQCQATFALTPGAGPSGAQLSVLASISDLVDSVSFYNVNGAEANMTFNQATGLEVSIDAPIGGILTDAATTAVFSPPNAPPLYLQHIVLGNAFFGAETASQNALLVHELLHIVLGSHENIASVFNITSSFVEANGGNLSIALTSYIQGGCLRP